MNLMPIVDPDSFFWPESCASVRVGLFGDDATADGFRSESTGLAVPGFHMTVQVVLTGCGWVVEAMAYAASR
jgi:hypothetical protein